VAPLLERQAPGIVHLILSTSLQKTPMAALSRPVAGTIGPTFVVTLPGSVKAVRENLGALFCDGVLLHAIDLCRGGSGRGVHAQMAAADGRSGARTAAAAQPGNGHGHDHGHHHHHHHHHATPKPRTILSNDPSQPGTFHLPCLHPLQLNARSLLQAARITLPSI
jgi:gephyrin